MIIKICSKFNSIEWETGEIPDVEQLQTVYDILSSIEVKEEDYPEKKPKDPNALKNVHVQFATQKQKNYMKYLGIEYPKNCTSDQARKLIAEYHKNLEEYGE